MKLASPVDCPYYLITRATRAVTARLRKGLADRGAGNVKPAYLGVLMSLWREDGLKANELARRAGLEPSTMTGLLDRMERDGLLERRADPHDRRASRIHLTQDGIDAGEPATVAVTKILDKAFQNIPEADIETTKAVLRTILMNCSKEDFSNV